MGCQIDVTSVEYLDFINGMIHDNCFSVEQVRFDHEAGTLEVPFTYVLGEHVPGRWLLPRYTSRDVPAALVIGRVTSYVLEESEGVRDYDFNVLEYSEVTAALTVHTNIPLRFTVSVKGLSLTVKLPKCA